jgi:hypothetical protein
MTVRSPVHGVLVLVMSYTAKCRQWIVTLLTVAVKRDLNFPFLLSEQLEISLFKLWP